MKKTRVVELFAGVGGFRLGLEKANGKDNSFEVVWSSQWEPGAATQHASDIYIHNFGGKGHSCEDVANVVEKDFSKIPDHDLLVGGFPCQDYSVAKTLSQSAGIYGKKGVLWWSIHGILHKKGAKAPKYLLLENVDRLLKSPVVQRGRDFAVMLASLSDLGYAVEWRVINAAEYGFPQRRRRVFIIGYKKGTPAYKLFLKQKDKKEWLMKNGVIATGFPVKKKTGEVSSFVLDGKLEDISKRFSSDKPSKSPFENSGAMCDRNVWMLKVDPDFKGKGITLGDVIEKNEARIPPEFFIKDSELKRWEYLKGGKNEGRKSKDGFEYSYSEGAMVFPDALDKPSRTIITGEGGTSPSRFKHVIRTKSGKLRRLMPIELERLNMFPDDHTKLMSAGKQAPDTKRAFIMGNALVVGVITRLGKALSGFF